MAAGVKKLTIGGEHTAEQAVGYLADPQARGDYYSEGGAALMFWLATPRSRTYFGLGEWVSRANREIAERLFVSHRTVGSHLYHIFPKLGITARTQLRDALKAAAGQYQSLD